MQKYDVTYVYRLYKSKIRLYLLNVLVKDFSPMHTVPRYPASKRPQNHGFLAITLHFGVFLKFKRQKLPNLCMYKQR